MKSGLEDRNNLFIGAEEEAAKLCLNEVRPGRPEQSERVPKSSPDDLGLNEVRPGRPEQSAAIRKAITAAGVSMKSGLEDRNNQGLRIQAMVFREVSH